MSDSGTEAVLSEADYVAGLVRERDRVRYYADLFAPADARGHLLALHAMNAEICGIPASVAEPGLGDIRFQWWQDAIVAAAEGRDEGQTPVMRGVARTIRTCRLPADALANLVSAHRNDLYGDPWATLQDLEGYFGETDAALFQLAGIILGSNGTETAEASGHAGIAFGLSRQIAGLPDLRNHGRQIASLDLLEIYGLERDSMFAEQPPAGSEDLLVHLTNLAFEHLRAARRAMGKMPRRFRRAFLPLAIVPGLLRRVSRRRNRLWQQPVELSDLSTLTRIARAALLGV